ncbi:MAG: metallophosphoesterase [Clostridiales bacterium]|nr:metallophosphoesterase [Clostridiales bacterium]
MKRVINLLCIAAILIGLVSCESVPEQPTSATPASMTTIPSPTAPSTESSSVPTTASASQATTSTTPESTTNATDPHSTTHAGGVFDEDRIVFSFAAITDTHLNFNGTASTITVDKTKKAYSVLKEWASKHDEDGLDAVIHIGDLVHSHNKDFIGLFKKIYDEYFDVTKVPLVYCLGDGHDVTWSADAKAAIADFTSTFGVSYYLYDVDEDQIAKGNRHCVINGYHFIALEPVSRSPITYDTETKAWLDKTLSDITSENPDAYVFILTHPMITGTAYGSELGTSWATSDLTDILSKYPQAVTFGGHLHYAINDERSIMQSDFTAIGCGAVYYTCVETEAAGNAVTLSEDTNQGLLVQLDADGDMRITRLDFANNAEIKTAWELSAPMADGSHLTRYTQKRSDGNTAPTFAEGAKIEVADGGYKTKLTMPTANDDDMVHHYIFKITDVNANTTKIMRQEADYYNSPDLSSLAQSLEFKIVLGADTEYLFELYAYDSWGAVSEPLTLTYKSK